MSENQPAQAGTKIHAGGCQCGAVRYEATLDLGGKLLACNCSRCGRLGTVLTFTQPEHFTLQSGADHLTTYHFNKHVIDHKFCKTCGIESFAEGKTPDGKSMIAVNVRCLDDVDLDALTITKVDGKKF